MANSLLPIPLTDKTVHLCIDMQRLFSSEGPWPWACVAHHPVPAGWLSLHQGAGNQIGISKFGGDREFERALPGGPARTVIGLWGLKGLVSDGYFGRGQAARSRC